MKTKLFIFVAVAIFISSCKSDESILFQETQDAVIIIKADTASMQDSFHLSTMEIVKQVNNIMFYNLDIFDNKPVGYDISMSNKEISTNNQYIKIPFPAIITTNGTLDNTFIDAKDVVFRRLFVIKKETTDTILFDKHTMNISDGDNLFFDTIAYIPNCILVSAGIKIKTAFKDRNSNLFYHLLENEFYFIPITGEEWRCLKLQNQQ